MPKNFQFTTYKKDDYYIAECWYEGQKHTTSADTEDELFDQVADLYKTILDIRCSWYRRLIYFIFRV